MAERLGTRTFRAWTQAVVVLSVALMPLVAAVIQAPTVAAYSRDGLPVEYLDVPSPSAQLFDIALSPGDVSDMRKAGIDITYVELPTNKGHMASHADAALWAPILGAFLKRLT